MQIATYPEIQDKNFNRDIFRRREFHVEKDGKKDLDAVQTRLKRYQGPRTGYENLLLFHEMGSGKTRSSLSIAENALISTSEFVDGQNKVWVGRKWFQPSQTQMGGLYKIKSWNGNKVTVDIEPWGGKKKVNKKKWCKARGGCTQVLRIDQVPPVGNRQKIVFVSKTTKFAQEIVEPELEKMYPNLSEVQLRAHIRKNYSLLGYNQFAKIVEENPNWIDNAVVIIDEVHNLVPMDGGKEDKKKKIRYNTIKKSLRKSQNRFVVLLTGTPMINSPNEIIWILQLLASRDAGDPNKLNFSEVKEWTKSHSKGVVSYLKKVSSAVPMKFEGKIINPLKHFKVVSLRMQGDQLKAYNELGKVKDFNTQHRQHGIIAPPTGVDWGDLTYKIFRNKNLRNFSVKYSWILSKLDEPENLPMYVYSNYVNGGGIRFLVDILKKRGYQPLTPDSKNRAKRYFLITGSLVNKKEMIRAFNQKSNRNGKVCRIIIGGPSSIEGFTFRNIRMEVILNPPFSYSDVAQALARGVRAGSHDQPRPAYVKAVQLIAQPQEGKDGVDLEMYSQIEKKDIRIKQIEYILKKNAWDCAFNKNYNAENREDYSRECDYKRCDYTCDGVSQNEIDAPTYNTNTWDIYYAPREPAEIEIIRIFRNTSSISVQTLINQFKGRFSPFLILTIIDNLIKSRQPMPMWYGRKCYLISAGDQLCLTHNILNSAPVLALPQLWYVENPMWYPLPVPQQAVSVPESSEMIDQLKTLLNNPNGVLQGRTNTNQACPAIGQFPLRVQFKLLIGALIATREHITNEHQNKVAKEILEYFTPVYTTTQDGDTIISLLLEFESPPGDLKILPVAGGEPRNATATEKAEYISKRSQRPKSIYGTQNISQPGDEWSCAFCLVPRDVNIPAELLKNKNKSQWDEAWKKFSQDGKISEKKFKQMIAWIQEDFDKPIKPKKLKDKSPHKPPWDEEQAKNLLRKIGQKGLHQKTVGSNICADARLSAKGLIGHLLDLKVSPPKSLQGLNNQPYGKSCPVSKLSKIPKPIKWGSIQSKSKVWKQIRNLLQQPLVNGKKSGGTLQNCRWSSLWKGEQNLKKALEGYAPYLEKAGTKSILQGALLKHLRQQKIIYPDKECANPTRLKK